MAKEATLSEENMREFFACHRLPKAFQLTAEQFYLPLAKQLPELRARHQPKSVTQQSPLFLGINGAQGTGKSTLADFLQMSCEAMHGWNVAVISIDDFYYTRDERTALAKQVHPLLMTRGVPGTHDAKMLAECIAQLKQLKPNEKAALPRFDKATDDRESESRWPSITGPIDLIILEGWCVGSQSQEEADIKQPINELEQEEDSAGVWRTYSNQQLERHLEPIFSQLDALVFLKAPSFEAIRRWRLEQEQKLAAKPGVDTTKLLDGSEINRFIQFYERLTRANLAKLPNSAEFVFDIDESHQVVELLRN